MRIAIPLAGASLAEHFGHCEKFALIDVHAATREVGATAEIQAPPHQPGQLPPWLKERGVTHVIAGRIGSRAQDLLREAAIEVASGAPAAAPAWLVERYLAGSLVTTPQVCDH